MAWSHCENPGAPVRTQSVGNAPTATNLGTHVASATVVGNSVSGRITLTADATGGTTGVQARFPFGDLVQDGVYSVTATYDSQASTGTQTGTGLSAGVFTNSDVASLYVSLSTGMAASQTFVVSYHIERVN